MFERFTEKAINVVYDAQQFAIEFKNSEVKSEHLLLALATEAKGVSLKLFRMYGINTEKLKSEIMKYLPKEEVVTKKYVFSTDAKNILKSTLDLATKSGNQNILFEHLFISVITDKNSNIRNVLDIFGFDYINAQEILTKLVQKKTKKSAHPETEENDERKSDIDDDYESSALKNVFEGAVSKLSTSGYEILGTEQILASILDIDNSDLRILLNKYGINSQTFEEKLSQISSRNPEYEDKKIIFTPNAFHMINNAIQIAKEFGSSSVTPEHVVLSILKTKKGLAYDIIHRLGVNDKKLQEDIIKPIERQMPETLSIMKLAKEEARRIGRNVVGTEMFLLGIIGEGTSMAAELLDNLEVTMKDARIVVENLVGYGNEYFDEEITFTRRAKRVLERAWILAQKANKQRIEAIDLLVAITNEPDSLAMKALNNLGVDAVEIKHGINKCK